MVKKSSYFMVLALVFLSGCASETTTQDNTESNSGSNEAEIANSEDNNDSSELICRRELQTGTNFRRRVCMTRAERDRERNDSQEEMLERRSSNRL